MVLPVFPTKSLYPSLLKLFSYEITNSKLTKQINDRPGPGGGGGGRGLFDWNYLQIENRPIKCSISKDSTVKPKSQESQIKY